MAPSDIFAGNQRNKMHFSDLIFAFAAGRLTRVFVFFRCSFARHLDVKFPKARPTLQTVPLVAKTR